MRSRKRSTICSTASDARAERGAAQEQAFRTIFRRVHAGHLACRADEWLMQPCREADGSLASRPIVWSRRNGAWRRVPLLIVGAAPGNAGGRGSGGGGAHGTRIPFGGDVAGANLDVLLGTAGLDRNGIFIVAALNQLPAAGGGEPTAAELVASVGDYASSFHLLRDTMLAAGPRLIVALGHVALRALIAAARVARDVPRMPTVRRLQQAGITRGELSAWPTAELPDADFEAAWQAAWPDSPLPSLLLCWHPSGQNMSPFAAADTLFFRRMSESVAALRAACATLALPRHSAATPPAGIYALPEWRARIQPYHERLAALWRARGLA